jgi:hypothetical protein
MDDGKQCMGSTCGTLKTQQVSAGNACKVKERVKEDWDSCKLRSSYIVTVDANYLIGITELPGMAMPMNL